MSRTVSADAARGASPGILWRFARPHAPAIIASAALAVIAAALALIPFWVVFAATRSLVADESSAEELLRLAALAALGIVLHYLAFGVSSWLSHVSSYRALAAMRLETAGKLGRLPVSSVAARRSGGLKTVLIDDIERLEVFLAHGLPDAIAAIVIWLSMAVWMFAVDWRLAIAAVIVVPLAFASLRWAMADAAGYGARYGAATARMNAVIAETITALPVVSSFVPPTRRLGSVAKVVRDQAGVARDLGTRFFTRASAFYVLIAAGGVLVVPAAAWLSAAGAAEADTVVFFMIVSLGANAPLVKLFALMSQMVLLLRSARSVGELLAEADQPDAHAVIGEDHTIVLDEVTAGYDSDAPVLHDISLRIEPGTVTALVGPSGSGKSTVARLLTRIVDAPGIRIGGVELGEVPVERLGRIVSTVAQEPFLFSGTIAENIAMGRAEADRTEIERVAVLARVTDFARHLPGGLDCAIGERGSTISGGQAQRIAIARTLLADTPILILDEATAHADPDNEAAIQDALSVAMVGRTLIVIAHRLTTITAADQIVVLDHGSIVARGRHENLLAAGGLYARMWADSDLEVADVPTDDAAEAAAGGS